MSAPARIDPAAAKAAAEKALAEAAAAEAELAAALGRLAPRFAPGAEGVQGLTRLSGGASQETWAFRAGDRDLILRRRPAAARPGGEGLPLDVEAELIARAGEQGAPVPGVVLRLAPEHRAGVGFVMDRVPGETLPARILRKPEFAGARAVFAAEAGAILAAIHRADGTGLGLETHTPETALARLAGRHKEFGQDRPVFDLAFRRLAETAPATRAPRLLHGDFRMGNILFGPDGVRAVLDWEMAHLGDPMSDFGWVCMGSWRFGGEGPVGGCGAREDMWAAYEAAGGEPVDPKSARWWETFAALHWGVIIERMGAWIRAGADFSVERHVIARRASETELLLIADLTGREI
ncbi:MAG: phosphotransferase family protein [Pseudomonadota bacterium]|nr:phosphotransferase family protein [Pseudomonadota bacterium]